MVGSGIPDTSHNDSYEKVYMGSPYFAIDQLGWREIGSSKDKYQYIVEQSPSCKSFFTYQGHFSGILINCLPGHSDQQSLTKRQGRCICTYLHVNLHFEFQTSKRTEIAHSQPIRAPLPRPKTIPPRHYHHLLSSPSDILICFNSFPLLLHQPFSSTTFIPFISNHHAPLHFSSLSQSRAAPHSF